MAQFYFLAIFVNLIGGIYFANDFLATKFPKVVKVVEFFENSTSKFVFAVVAGITGLFKIISVSYGDVPVVGDLLIAATSIIICLYFLKDTISNNAKPAPAPAEPEQVATEPEPVATETTEEEPTTTATTEAATADAATKEDAKKVDIEKACGSFYSTVDKFKTAIGILAIALAVLHFCFPAIVLI